PRPCLSLARKRPVWDIPRARTSMDAQGTRVSMCTSTMGAVRGAAALGLLVGCTVGVVWVLLALGALTSTLRGVAAGRPDWVLGWALVGVLLMGAGLSALIGSWLHHRTARH